MVERRLTDLVASLGPIHPDVCCAGAAGAEVSAARGRVQAPVVFETADVDGPVAVRLARALRRA